MLPIEIQQHSQTIFSRLMASWLVSKGNAPSGAAAAVFADAAVRMANQFSSAAVRHTPPEQGVSSPAIKPITFEALVHEWLGQMTKAWQKADRLRVLNRFERYLFPSMGSRPASELAPPELVAALRAVEDCGYLPLAHLILRETKRVYRFAIASGYALHNPAADIRGALYPWRPRSRATILLPKRIGELLRAIDSYNGYTTSKYMLRLLPLVFVRPGELRKAEWAEIDFKASEWRIPGRRMKARRPHIVPLSKQAKAIFRQVHRVTGHGKYVFASEFAESGIMSEHLCKSMLQSIGFGGEMTMGGFRSMASTLLNEQGWSADAIERQLAHQDARPIRRAYNFAQYLPERRRMMQAWADHLNLLQTAESDAST